jgi:acyl transferase domain-containing protein
MKFVEDDVSVIGMACLFPDAPNLGAFWENIVAARCSISDSPAPQTHRFVDPASKDFARIYTTRGGYLKDLSTFDPLEFGVMPDSVAGGNPNHFVALRLAREALDDAGLGTDRFPRERTDFIVGCGEYVNPGNANWLQHGLFLDQAIDVVRQLHPEYSAERLEGIRSNLKATLPPMNAAVIPSVIPNILAGRVANRLDLMGANYVIDAACSSSLIAIDLGVNNLLLGKSDLALVGGITAGMPAQGLMIFSQLGALSRQPALRPFDRHADGTMLGEGAGIVVLKRRGDAEKDGNRIYANIKGIGVASDGRASGLLAPRLEGEALAIQRAYEAARIAPETVGLIEAHGTGIPLGDSTEIHALARVFGARKGRHPTCGVGSIKSMIGHTISAAGVAGFIKAALGLHHRVLPPTVNCDEPHPDLELEKMPFYINVEARPWVHGAREPRRAGISAMGFGGINVHCVMEEHR